MSSLDKDGPEYDERPRGSYTALDDQAPNYKVKRIAVLSGRRRSYQTHTRRSEHWFIVSGAATAILKGRFPSWRRANAWTSASVRRTVTRITVPRRWGSSKSKPVRTLAKTTSCDAKTIMGAASRRRDITWSGIFRPWSLADVMAIPTPGSLSGFHVTRVHGWYVAPQPGLSRR